MAAFRHRQQHCAAAYDLLPPERRPPAPATDRFGRKGDISDAEFVIVSPSRPSASSAKMASGVRRPYSPPRASGRLASLPGPCLRAAERWLQLASGRVFACLVLAACVLMFGLAGGFSGLSADAAARPPSPALQFSHVTLTPRDQNGMRLLVLNGIVENNASASLDLKPIRADLLAGDQVVASVVVAPPAAHLNAGESRGFMARLQHPGGKMPEVRLSFMP